MGLECIPGEVKQLYPADAPLAAHCRRVSALAVEIAHRTSFPPGGTALLRQAALLHHFPPLLLDVGALRRLLPDVLPRAGAAAPELASAAPLIPEDLATVLQILHCRFNGSADPLLRKVAAVLQLSDMLDEQMQLLAYEDSPPDGIWAGLEEISEFTLFDRQLVQDARRVLTAGGSVLAVAGTDLAVQARTARKVFSVLAFHADCEIRALEKLATSDPVLAGRLIQVANSALYSPVQHLGSVRQAITYVGIERTRKVMLAAALEPVFSGGGMHQVWKHSLRAAQLSEALARATGVMDAEEALLLGLVHDIGRQQTQRARANQPSMCARLLNGGCPLTYVERFLFQRDHGDVGAEVLKTWDFPEHLIEAVRCHHRPEASEAVHAAVLYLIEFWTGGEEDLPSLTRLGSALARTGVSGETLMAIAPPRGSLYEALGAA